MSLRKYSVEAMLQANKFVDRTAKQLGWLLNQEDLVQESSDHCSVCKGDAKRAIWQSPEVTGTVWRASVKK